MKRTLLTALGVFCVVLAAYSATYIDGQKQAAALSPADDARITANANAAAAAQADATTGTNGVSTNAVNIAANTAGYPAADTVISNGVVAEANAAAVAADTVVSNGVVAEAAAAATAADTVISNGVTAAFQAADTVISNGVVAEASAASIAADTVVSNGVVAQMTAADSVISNGVTAAYQAADTVVSNGVVAEAAAAAVAADTVISNGVTSAYIAADGVISNGVVAEMTAADTVVSNGLSAQLIAADAVVSNGVVAEAAAAATAADTIISNGVTAAYVAADTIVSNGVVAEAGAAATAADTVISNGVTAAFQAADTVISNGVVAEVQALAVDTFGAPTDNTDGDMSTSAHGFAPKGSGVAGEFLDSDGGYSVPAGSSAKTNRFHVRLLDSQSINSGTETTLALTNPVIDTASAWDNSTFRYKFPETGDWLVGMSQVDDVRVDAASLIGIVQLVENSGATTNSALYIRSIYSGVGGLEGTAGSVVIPVASTNDEVYATFEHDAGSAKNVLGDANDNFTFLYGIKLN